jgi:hypothetical protein
VSPTNLKSLDGIEDFYERHLGRTTNRAAGNGTERQTGRQRWDGARMDTENKEPETHIHIKIQIIESGKRSRDPERERRWEDREVCMCLEFPTLDFGKR